MIAPIHKSTGSSQDCRRGCAEWSNSLWRLPGPKHTVRISCVYDGSCVYDHPRTRKMVPKENIFDAFCGSDRFTATISIRRRHVDDAAESGGTGVGLLPWQSWWEGDWQRPCCAEVTSAAVSGIGKLYS